MQSKIAGRLLAYLVAVLCHPIRWVQGGARAPFEARDSTEACAHLVSSKRNYIYSYMYQIPLVVIACCLYGFIQYSSVLPLPQNAVPLVI